ncbi:MAG TPA: phytanoyl-CoA dioxygenase family protein [Steroidobacteraceae bacterium]|nr:phytanoyl-CoA dioxygenase family protein [Steroidobacteraceae bacterium]
MGRAGLSVMEASQLTSYQHALLPDEHALAWYDQHGWWISPPCVPDELLDDVLYGVERFYQGDRDWQLMINLGTDWRPEHGEKALRVNDYLSLQIEEFRSLVRYPLIGAMAARLARTTAVRLFHDQLLFKPPGSSVDGGAIGWHTDKSYWQTCSSEKMLTAWIPLHDCTAEMGSLAVFDGSHRWAHSDDLSNFAMRQQGPADAQVRQRYGSQEPTVLELRRGQVSFHHCRTVHGSKANLSALPRIACAVHFQDDENSYRRAKLPDGRLATHINDLLCRRSAAGFPDYADPAICPQIWPHRGDSVHFDHASGAT